VHDLTGDVRRIRGAPTIWSIIGNAARAVLVRLFTSLTVQAELVEALRPGFDKLSLNGY
jgi:hypothetical protein